MQSKRFRNNQFYPGDLVKPVWNDDGVHGKGIVLQVNDTVRYITVRILWQNGKIVDEAPMDVEVISQVDLD